MLFVDVILTLIMQAAASMDFDQIAGAQGLGYRQPRGYVDG